MGKGKVYLQALNTTTGVPTGPLVDVGNVSKLALNVAEDKQEMIDYQSAGGGVMDSITRIKSVSLDMTALSFSQENLAVALRGTSAAVSVTPIAGEAVTVALGGLNMLAKTPASATAIVVKDETDTDTYVAGVDYVQTRAGFTVPAGSAILDGDVVNVSYTPATANLLQGLTAAANSMRVVFEGLNEARSGKAVVIDCFKVQFSPTKGLDLIGDKFGELTLSGTLLKDENKLTGSQYLTVSQVS